MRGAAEADAESDADVGELEVRADALRRVVYGTPGGYDSSAASDLAALERRIARACERGDGRIGPEPPTRTPVIGSVAEPVAEPVVGQRRRRRLIGWAIAAAVVIAAGAIVAGVIRGGGPPRGMAVFERPQTTADTALRGYEVQLGRRATTLRHVGRVFGHDAWVFLERGDVCLIVQRLNWAGWGGTCVDERIFARHGITRLLTYDDVSGSARPAGLLPGEGVELRWGPDSTGIEWSVVGGSVDTGGRERVWVPTLDGGDGRTFGEWTSDQR